jgi:signal transduction histidine kinase
MLQLANLSSASQKSLCWVDVDLAEQLRWCINQVEPLAQERNIVLEHDLESMLFVGVEDYLKMLFANLLSNAVTYSYEGGRVQVRCRRMDDSECVVTIADKGIGIPAEKLPHIFEEHYRTNEAVQHNKEASGLGLAIVAGAAELHGIRLKVESQPGVGTTFELRFFMMKEKQNGLPVDH